MSELGAGRQLEAQFVQLVMKEFRKALPKELAGGKAGEMFSELFDQEIAKRLAEGGQLGLAEVIDDQMARSGRLQNPIDGQMTATSHFGWRRHPVVGEMIHHDGLDLHAEQGTPIRPIKPGNVVFAGDKGGYGNLVVVEHDDGTTSRYAHCEAILVDEGARVGFGDTLGTVGQTGTATGPHLHLELRDAEGRAVDPGPILGIEKD